MGSSDCQVGSIFAPVPHGLVRIHERYEREEYVSLYAYLPGSPRQETHSKGRGQLFIDFDGADWLLWQHHTQLAGLDQVTAETAKKALKKRLLYSLSDADLDALLDKHQDQIEAVLAHCGLTATYIVRSGYGHHVHILTDRWDRTKTTQNYVGEMIGWVNSQLGYEFADPGGNGSAQICREIGTYNRKSPDKPRLVRVVGGDPGARLSLDSVFRAPADLPGAGEIRAEVVRRGGHPCPLSHCDRLRRRHHHWTARRVPSDAPQSPPKPPSCPSGFGGPLDHPAPAPA